MHRLPSLLVLTVLLLASGPARPAEPDEAGWPLLVIVPLGEPAPDLVEHLAASLRARFRMRVQVTKPEPLPQAAWYPPRKRWRAEKLLRHLERMDLGDAWRVCGITEAPISTTKGKRYDYGIAGLATIGGKAGVLTAWLFRRVKNKSRRRYLRYMDNLVLHEMGHTLGLDHCPLPRCIMADAKGNALRAARRSINQFCPRCTRLLLRHLRDPEVRGKWTRREKAVLKKKFPDDPD